ncbi:MAG: terminase [Chloroflexi bacterium]|nr:terminase [Chloroflexota bacterium]
MKVSCKYQPRGGALKLFYNQDSEVVISGPAGTGKTRAALEKLDYYARKYPGMRAAIVRRTRLSMTQTVLVTYRKRVIHWDSSIRFRTGEQEFRYPNGSIIALAGLDKPGKVLSAEYDLIFFNQAEEGTVHQWEFLLSRLRNNVVPFQQIIGDCNPDRPTHWLKQRCDAGMPMIESRHQDNPLLWDEEADDWTEAGRAYMEKLDRLTGVRYLRLRKGLWAAAEGMVYENWDPAIHLLDSFSIPADWRRFRVIDFGYTNPFCCQWWTVDGDGRMYLYREIYMTKRTVRVHARAINAYSVDERIETTVCDWDAEDRATLEENGIATVAAKKEISVGVQAVQERLLKAGDGRARIFLLRGALIERDPVLVDEKRPTCTEEEITGYVWPPGVDGKPDKEAPVKLDDHGMDAMRYAVRYLERAGTGESMIVAPTDVLDRYDRGF